MNEDRRAAHRRSLRSQDGSRDHRVPSPASVDDLSRPEPQEFTARGDMKAETGHAYAPKDQVPCEIWISTEWRASRESKRGEPGPAGRTHNRSSRRGRISSARP